MSIGWSLAIKAALSGAKFVAVVTDINHHDHPASAMLDDINESFSINDARVIFTNYVRLVGIKGTEIVCSDCSGFGCERCDGTGTDFSQKGKDWADILNRLTITE